MTTESDHLLATMTRQEAEICNMIWDIITKKKKLLKYNFVENSILSFVVKLLQVGHFTCTYTWRSFFECCTSH